MPSTNIQRSDSAVIAAFPAALTVAPSPTFARVSAVATSTFTAAATAPLPEGAAETEPRALTNLSFAAAEIAAAPALMSSAPANTSAMVLLPSTITEMVPPTAALPPDTETESDGISR